MKAHAYSRHGKEATGRLIELPDPTPSPTELLVEMHAASVNPVDFKIRNGDLRFLRKSSFPLILGGDGAGIVRAIGGRVAKFKIGDKVYFRIPKEKPGTFAELVTVPEEVVALTPGRISLTEAAALPLVCLTTIQALFEVAALRAGARVFIPAGSGGIGSHAIQIAKIRGLSVATTTSTRNLEWVRSLGPDQILDYTQGDPTEQLRDFDAVYDTLGGVEQRRAFRVLRSGGILVSIVGPPTASTARELGLGAIKTFVLWMMSSPARRAALRHGARYEFVFMRPDGAQLAELATWVDEGRLKPIVDRVFPLEKADEALQYLANGRARGKVLLEIHHSRLGNPSGNRQECGATVPPGIPDERGDRNRRP